MNLRFTSTRLRSWIAGSLALLMLAAITVEGRAQDRDVAIDFSAPAEVSPLASIHSEPRSSDAAYEELRESAEDFELPFQHIRNVIQVVRPSVVHIEAIKNTDSNGVSRTIEEAGAGIVFEHQQRLFVLTNRHVIHQADKRQIQIQMANGVFFHPTLIWTDPGTDLAVMEASEDDLTACRIGRSDSLEIGDFVIAIGSPFGLNHSASYGIVSAKGRRDLQLGNEGVRYQDFIQTDAAINPGNSGGPLINLAGEVVGINTAIASNSGSNEGIGFAIPIDMAMKVAVDLIEKGQVQRAFLGVSLDAQYTPEVASQLGLRTIYGARVAGITRGSPAEEAELAPGDVILRYDDRVVENDSHLVQVVSMTPIGTEVPVDVYREGKTSRVMVIVRDRRRFDPRN